MYGHLNVRLGTGVCGSDLVTLLRMKGQLHSKHFHMFPQGFVQNCIAVDSLVLKIALIRTNRILNSE